MLRLIVIPTNQNFHFSNMKAPCSVQTGLNLSLSLLISVNRDVKSSSNEGLASALIRMPSGCTVTTQNHCTGQNGRCSGMARQEPEKKNSTFCYRGWMSTHFRTSQEATRVLFMNTVKPIIS